MKSAIESVLAGSRRCPSWVRVLALAFIGAGVATVSILGTVGAQLDRTFIRAGEGAQRILRARSIPARSLNLNGVRLSLHTGVVDEPLEEVLRRQARDCLPRGHMTSVDSVLLASLSVRMGSSEDDGYVACVELGENADSLVAFTEAARRFAATWDVAELGGLRYVYARRADEAPTSRTMLFSLWSHGSVDLKRMLPGSRSDADGADPPGVPRLPGTQRVLSAYEVDEPSGVFVYRTAASADVVARFFRTELRRAGWSLVSGRGGAPLEVEGVRLVAAVKGGDEVTVLCPSPSLGSKTLTLLWSGRRA